MNRIAISTTILVMALISAAPKLAAQEIDEQRDYGGARLEAMIGVHSWPAMADLQPLVPGEFDDTGFGLAGAVHWPVRQWGTRELLLGVDLNLFSSESNIRLISDELIARGGYIAPSVKWVFGDRHRYSLDAGVGLYVVDIAQVMLFGGNTPEAEVWESSGVGGYVGGTWDLPSRAAGRNRGWSVAFKAHFFDLGNARDDDPLLPPRLGSNAGAVEGPVYQLLFGYRWL